MIETRDMASADRRFVVPTWVRSSRYDLRQAERFKLVDRVLDRGARVVVIGGAGSTVHAWAAGEDDVLHFVYVPPELRNKGFARRAITALFGQYAEHISTSHPWPRPSRRFRYHRDALLRREAA